MGPRWPGITEEPDRIRKMKNVENSKKYRLKLLAQETPEQKEERLRKLREKERKTKETPARKQKGLEKDRVRRKLKLKDMQFKESKIFTSIATLKNKDYEKMDLEALVKIKTKYNQYLKIYNLLTEINETDPKVLNKIFGKVKKRDVKILDAKIKEKKEKEFLQKYSEIHNFLQKTKTDGKREERLKKRRERSKERKLNETAEDKEIRLARKRERAKERKLKETPEQREERLKKQREKQRKYKERFQQH